MSDPAVIAASLTYMQRKTLRRLARGQTITRAMCQDPLIRTFYTHTNTHPQINKHGKQVHNELEGQTQ